VDLELIAFGGHDRARPVRYIEQAISGLSPRSERQAKEKAKQEAIQAEMQSKLNEVTKTFKQRYNADPTCKDTIKDKPISTYALQKALIRSDRRPVFAAGILFDI
jgi:hypothetical protein